MQVIQLYNSQLGAHTASNPFECRVGGKEGGEKLKINNFSSRVSKVGNLTL